MKHFLGLLLDVNFDCSLCFLLLVGDVATDFGVASTDEEVWKFPTM